MVHRMVTLALILCASGCVRPAPRIAPALSPPRDRPVAEVDIEDPSASAFEARFGGAVRDAIAEARMADLGRRLLNATPQISADLSYHLLKSDEPNAFSMPHRVYITVGLWRKLDDDDIIAAALAHEFAHIHADDSLRPKALAEGEALGREMQADRRALAYMERAGFDPQALARIIMLVAHEQPAGWADARIAALERGRKSVARAPE